MSNRNPIINPKELPFKAVEFSNIKNEHFIPAVEEGIKRANSINEELSDDKSHATFENTMIKLETSDGLLGRASSIYFHLFGSESDSDMQAMATTISPMLSKCQNDFYLNESIFNRIESIYNDMSDLNDEDRRLVETYYKNFIRNGAKLSTENKDRLRDIDEKLAKLSPKFSNNVLNATNTYYIHITDSIDLGGLPDALVDSAKEDAKNRDLDGWIFTHQMPSYLPFMKYCNKRELRKKLFISRTSACYGDKFDNTDNIKEIVSLRHQRAKILGYNTHAEYVLENRMAENADKVFGLLDNLYKPSYSAAKNEIQELEAFAKDLDGVDRLESWDISYYSEKLKMKLYDFDQESLRPYFKSENVVRGVFDIATKLYGVSFSKLDNIDTWHDDVNTYEVKDEDGSHLGILYEDLYPRSTKRGGAWMNELRSAGLSSSGVERPLVTFNCNLTKSTADKPSLLTFDEVETVFHEFGHALHGLFSQCTYTTLGGTSVLWDFVELPSQIMENWACEKNALGMFANHYQTGETIPDDLIDRLIKSKSFQAGNASLRQLTFGFLDMAWHNEDSSIENIEEFEDSILEKTRLLPKVPGTIVSSQFAHIFAGGYSAGYYSYKWAEVLEADAFGKFKEDGIFNKETASSFRNEILSQGNRKHPMELYKSFRGREPEVKHLLERDNLV